MKTNTFVNMVVIDSCVYRHHITEKFSDWLWGEDQSCEWEWPRYAVVVLEKDTDTNTIVRNVANTSICHFSRVWICRFHISFHCCTSFDSERSLAEHVECSLSLRRSHDVT